MGHDYHTLSLEDLRADLIVPERKDTINCNLERLSLGEDILWKTLIPGIMPRVSLIINVKLRRRNVVAASPEHDLFFSVLGSSLSLVKTLKSTIVPLIESPVLGDWDVVTPKLSGNIVVSHNGASEHRCECKVKLIAILLE